MAYPFTVSGSTRQPQTPVRVNRKWLSRGMVASYNAAVGLPQRGMHDLARSNNNIGYATSPPGVYWSQDEIGTAWENDSGNDYAIKVVTTPDLTLTGPMTFEALVKVKAFQTTVFPYIAGVMGQYQRDAGDTVDEAGPVIRFNNNATVGNAAIPTFILFPPGGGEVQATGAAQSTNTPIHLIGVYNGSNLILWVNGVKTVGDSFTGSHLNNGDFLALLCEYITTNPMYGNRCLNGKMYFANIYNRGLTDAEARERFDRPWGHLHDTRRLWILLGAAAGGGVDADVAGTQATDVGAIAVEATTGAALAGTQATDVGAITVEATTGAAIAGAQATDVGAITVEATTGADIAGTQASDGAAVEVTASTGETEASVAGTQSSDVGAITVEATLGLSIAGTQASDLGYIVVEATLPATMAGTQMSDVAAIAVLGTSIWTDVGVSAATWADVGGASSIWTDL